jgi:hypothetical protein
MLPGRPGPGDRCRRCRVFIWPNESKALITNDDGIDSAGLPRTLDDEAMSDDNSLRLFDASLAPGREPERQA